MGESNSIVVSVDQSFVTVRWDLESNTAPVKSDVPETVSGANNIDFDDCGASIMPSGALLGLMLNTHWHYHLVDEGWGAGKQNQRLSQRSLGVTQENLRAGFLEIYSLQQGREETSWISRAARLTIVWKPGASQAIRGVEFSDDGKGVLAAVHSSEKAGHGCVILWPDWGAPSKSYMLTGCVGSWSDDKSMVVTWDPYLEGSEWCTADSMGKCVVWHVKKLGAQSTLLDQMDHLDDGNEETEQELVELFPGHPEWSPRYKPNLIVGHEICTVVDVEGNHRVLWARFISISKLAICRLHTDVEVVVQDVAGGTVGCLLRTGIENAAGLHHWGDRVASGFESLAMSRDRRWLGLYVPIANRGCVWNMVQGLKVTDLTLPKGMLRERGLAFGGQGCRLMMWGRADCLLWNTDILTAALHRQSTVVQFTLPGQELEVPLASAPKAGSTNGCIVDLGFSQDGNRLGVIRSNTSTMYILDFSCGSVIPLAEEGALVTEFQMFAFSADGNRLASVMSSGRVLLWDLSAEPGLLGRKAEMGNLRSRSADHAKAITFSHDEEGNETVVVCEYSGSLIWMDTQNCLSVDRWEMVGQKDCRACLFQPDGLMAAIVPGEQDSVVVFDLVHRAELRQVPFFWTWGDLAPSPYSIARDGSFAVVGRDRKTGKPMLQMLGEQAVSSAEIQRVSNHLTISQDNAWVVFDNSSPLIEQDCPKQNRISAQQSTKLEVMPLFGDGRPKQLEADSIRSTEMMAASADGRRIACAGDGNRVTVWTPYASKGCIPDYYSLYAVGCPKDRKLYEDVLKRHAPALLNIPDAVGMTFLMHAIEDSNVDFVQAALDHAQTTETIVLLSSNPDLIDGIPDRSALEIACAQQSSDIAGMLIKAMAAGVVPRTALARFLHKSLVRLEKRFSPLVVEALSAEGMPTTLGDLTVPQDVFKGDRCVVGTTDVFYVPETALQELWVSMHSGTERSASRVEVPAVAKVYPFPDCCQVGMEGLLRPLLFSRKMPDSVFTTDLVRSVIQYKWQKYAGRMFVQELCVYTAYVLLFTMYGILLGHGDPSPEDNGDVGGGANGIGQAICLLLCSILGFNNLYGKVNQIKTYATDGRRHGFNGLWIWLWSRWNVVDLFSSVVTTFILPMIHFTATNEDRSQRESLLAAITLVVLWWKMLYFGQATRTTGPLVIAIFEIVKDIAFFIVTILLIQLGFGVAFFMVFQHNLDNEDLRDSFGTLSRSLFTTFGMMVGQFNLELFFETHHFAVALTMFLVYMVAVVIVLLNLLISVMGDSYDRYVVSQLSCS